MLNGRLRYTEGPAKVGMTRRFTVKVLKRNQLGAVALPEVRIREQYSYSQSAPFSALQRAEAFGHGLILTASRLCMRRARLMFGKKA